MTIIDEYGRAHTLDFPAAQAARAEGRFAMLFRFLEPARPAPSRRPRARATERRTA